MGTTGSRPRHLEEWPGGPSAEYTGSLDLFIQSVKIAGHGEVFGTERRPQFKVVQIHT